MGDSALKIVIVGHVDHGKSTLIGRLMYEAGGLPEDIRRELERKGFAYFTDHFEEEQVEEKTIDTAQAFFRSDKRQYVIIDTPGHKEFLKNMLTGASQADAAVLIVSAIEGIEEQTRRHAYLLKLLGIKQIAVVINKMDKVGYDEKVFRDIKQNISKFFSSLGVPIFHIIPISAMRGDNIAILSANMKWYSGATLFEILDRFELMLDLINASFRMPIQGIFEINNKKFCLGRVASGKIKVGEKVVVMPGKVKTEVRSIKVFGKEKREAFAGESIGLVLDDKMTIFRGQVISEANNLPKIGEKISARLFWMDQNPLSLSDKLTIRCGTAEATCQIKQIKERIDSSSLEIVARDAAYLKETEVAKADISVDGPIVFEDFAVVPELGRFVLQRNGQVCAGGIISGT